MESISSVYIHTRLVLIYRSVNFLGGIFSSMAIYVVFHGRTQSKNTTKPYLCGARFHAHQMYKVPDVPPSFYTVCVQCFDIARDDREQFSSRTEELRLDWKTLRVDTFLLVTQPRCVIESLGESSGWRLVTKL